MPIAASILYENELNSCDTDKHVRQIIFSDALGTISWLIISQNTVLAQNQRQN